MAWPRSPLGLLDLSDRLALVGDGDLLAGLEPVEAFGQMGLRFLKGNGVHGVVSIGGGTSF